MTISSSHTSLQATTNGAVKAIFELTTPKRAATAGEYDGMGLPHDNTATPVRAQADGAAADQTTEIPGLMSPQQRARWDAAQRSSSDRVWKRWRHVRSKPPKVPTLERVVLRGLVSHANESWKLFGTPKRFRRPKRS